MTKQTSLIEILIILSKRKRMIITTVLLITLLSLAIALIWPKSYKATTEFIYNNPSSMPISGLLSSIVPISTSSGKLGPEIAMLILKSKNTLDRLIKDHKLEEYYEIEIREALYKKIEQKTEILDMREGGFGFNPIISVSLSYSDEDPIKAYEIVQSYLRYLDSTLVELNNAANREKFKQIEKQYLLNQSQIKVAEQKLNKFQKDTGLINVIEQSTILVDAIGKLKQESIALQIQIETLNNIVSSNNSNVRQLIIQKSQVDQELKKMLIASDNEIMKESTQRSNENLFYSVNEFPDLMIQYGRLYRELEVQNKVYEYVFPLYVQAKNQLGDNYTGIQIVDKVRIPTYKDKPKRAVIVISGFLFSVFLSLIMIFYSHMIESDEYTRDKIQELKENIFKFNVEK